LQGHKALEGRLFYQVSLDQLVPNDHLVRRLQKVLDLSWMRSQTAAYYSFTGRPSIDPEVIAKMLLLGFLYNISSERRLMCEVQVNLAYRWYLGYDLDEDIPDHSVLSKARQRLGAQFFERLFSYAVKCCQQAGLVEGRNVLLDSTTVKADASLDSLISLRYRPSEYWEQLEKTAEPAVVVESAGPREHTDIELGSSRPRQGRCVDNKISTTDGDASLIHRKGQGSMLAYKAHVVADSHKGVITAVAVSSAAVDDTAAVPTLLSQHQMNVGCPKAIAGDSMYGSQQCLSYLQDRGIETVITVRAGGNKHGGFDKSEFSYDPQRDCYTCPAGQVLSRHRTDKRKCKAYYSCQVQVCKVCSLRSGCVGSSSGRAVRQITRYDNPYSQRAQAACESVAGRRLMNKRKSCMEGLFAQGKTQHGLARARWRGLKNVLIQALLTAVVLNVKKLLRVWSAPQTVFSYLGTELKITLTDFICHLVAVFRRLLRLFLTGTLMTGWRECKE
jgi:transposase